MKILFLDTPYTFKIIPRKEISENDTLIVDLKNEFTKLSTENVVNSFEIDGNYVVLTLDSLPIGAKHRDKFELTIKKEADIVYYGKILVLTEGTNVQNYKNERAKFQ